MEGPIEPLLSPRFVKRSTVMALASFSAGGIHNIDRALPHYAGSRSGRSALR